jgi:hypothetical protein
MGLSDDLKMKIGSESACPIDMKCIYCGHDLGFAEKDLPASLTYYACQNDCCEALVRNGSRYCCITASKFKKKNRM